MVYKILSATFLGDLITLLEGCEAYSERGSTGVVVQSPTADSSSPIYYVSKNQLTSRRLMKSWSASSVIR
jgi:hypothetical protein